MFAGQQNRACFENSRMRPTPSRPSPAPRPSGSPSLSATASCARPCPPIPPGGARPRRRPCPPRGAPARPPPRPSGSTLHTLRPGGSPSGKAGGGGAGAPMDGRCHTFGRWAGLVGRRQWLGVGGRWLGHNPQAGPNKVAWNLSCWLQNWCCWGSFFWVYSFPLPFSIFLFFAENS